MAEWLKAPVLKTGKRASVSRVRIPPHPPSLNYKILKYMVIIFDYLAALPSYLPFDPRLWRIVLEYHFIASIFRVASREGLAAFPRLVRPGTFHLPCIIGLGAGPLYRIKSPVNLSTAGRV